MKREEATKRLLAMAARLEAGEGMASLVDRVWLFGSYARGAAEVGDVDLDVEFTQDEEFRRQLVAAIASSRPSPYPALVRALRGSSRALQIQFENIDDLRRQLGIEPLLLWQRGDAVSTVDERLAAIAVDPQAGRARRDAVIGELEGLDRYVVMPDRITIALLDYLGAIRTRAFVLPDDAPHEPDFQFWLDLNWQADNPKRRAVSAAAAYLEREGLHPLIHNRRLSGDRERRRYTQQSVDVEFGPRRVSDSVSHACLVGPFSFCVLNPTARRGQLRALRFDQGQNSADLHLSVVHGDRELFASLEAELDAGRLPEPIARIVADRRASSSH